MCALQTIYNDELKKLKQLVVKNLDKRLSVTDMMQLSTLLDPATKSVSMDDAEEELLFKAVTTINTSKVVPLMAGKVVRDRRVTVLICLPQ